MVRLARPSSAFLVALAVLLAVLHALLAITASAGRGVAYDETAHLTAGRIYNTLDDYRLQPENGNLPQRWAALPLGALQPHTPSLLFEYWRQSETWGFSREFLFASGNAPEWLLLCGRSMIALFSAGLGLLIFYWAWRLFGPHGAFLSLGLFAFCPNFLAHGALVTSDVTMAFFFLASLTAWWRWREQPTWLRALLSATVFGLACVAKFSAVLLLPMMALSLVIAALVKVPLPTWRRCVVSAALHLVAAWAIIWLFYGFRYSAFNPALPSPFEDFNRSWAFFAHDTGLVPSAVAFARQWHLLPEAFLYGFLFVTELAQQRGAFLNGELSIHGWLSFFPVAFLLKTPVPILMLLVVAPIAWIGRLHRSSSSPRPQITATLGASAPLIALLVVYVAVSLTSHLNIGHRHLLPIYPVLFIFIGSLGAIFDRRHAAALVAVALLFGWQVLESQKTRPHYLAYFNQIAGGPEHGYRHLVDSSLDWGQDLPELGDWLRTHNRFPATQPVYLSYFGTGDPRYEGINATILPSLPQLPPAPPWYRLGPGLYCISATMLQHAYSPIHGPWTAEFEAEYQRLRAIEEVLLAYDHDPKRRAELQRDAPDAKWQAGWKRYDLLRFARLCNLLRAREPEAMIGYSILIYRLTAGDIDVATRGSLSALTRSSGS